MRVGIIGCGFIGSELAIFIDKSKKFRLIGLNDIDKNKVNGLIKRLKNNKPKFMELSYLIRKSDLIIESASGEVIKKILLNKNLDNANKKLIIMSTGGLVENISLLKGIKKCEIFLPSGAIAGLDSIKAISGRIRSLSLTTMKPARSLENAPYVAKNKIKLNDIKAKKIIFEGSLKNAIRGFPQNINVGATLYLASKFNGIKIKIVADPHTRFNIHEIKAVGNFGEIKIITKNVPSKNPRTSYLAVLSAVHMIKNIKNNLKIGN